MPSATHIAQEIRKKIYEKTRGMTASAGVSFNKFLAKVASDVNKPNGITVITPDLADEFINQLPVRNFFGVGKVTEEKMVRLGIKTGADLKKFSRNELIRIFGKAGNYFYDIAQGIDERPVEPDRIRKSVGKETTLSEDTNDVELMIQILDDLAVRVADILKRKNRKGLTVTLKIKYFDFQSITRSVTPAVPVTEAGVIMNHMKNLLENTEAGTKKVRLLGVTVSNFLDENPIKKFRQITLPFKYEPDIF